MPKYRNILCHSENYSLASARGAFGILWLMSLRGRQELESGDHEYLPWGVVSVDLLFRRWLSQ